jgi:hypothetical protein
LKGVVEGRALVIVESNTCVPGSEEKYLCQREELPSLVFADLQARINLLHVIHDLH